MQNLIALLLIFPLTLWANEPTDLRESIFEKILKVKDLESQAALRSIVDANFLHEIWPSEGPLEETGDNSRYYFDFTSLTIKQNDSGKDAFQAISSKERTQDQKEALGFGIYVFLKKNNEPFEPYFRIGLPKHPADVSASDRLDIVLSIVKTLNQEKYSGPVEFRFEMIKGDRQMYREVVERIPGLIRGVELMRGNLMQLLLTKDEMSLMENNALHEIRTLNKTLEMIQMTARLKSEQPELYHFLKTFRLGYCGFYLNEGFQTHESSSSLQ